MPTRRQALYENSQRNRKVALGNYRMGWPIDPVAQSRIADRLRAEIATCDDTLARLLGELKADTEDESELKFLGAFNPGSSQQLGRLFYDLLDEPVRFRTPQGSPSTGKAALESLERSGGEYAQAFARVLKRRKVAAKLIEAYIANLEGVELVRPNPHVTAQVAGRWSYRDPALQTVPSVIKPMFTAHPGGWMVACDLAGAEYRTMALQAGCVPMLQAYNQERDLHWETAEIMFGCSRDKLQKGKHRKIAKGVGLGFHYSVLDFEAAAAGLFGQVGHLIPGLTFEHILGSIRRLAEARPEIMDFKRRIWEKVQVEDYVEEPVHRRRRYFYGKPKDTEAYNFAQQAMIAAIIDRAIQAIDAEFQAGEGLLLQRHDELILGGPDCPRLCAMLWEHMRQTHTVGAHSILFELEFKVSRRWGEGVDIVPSGNGSKFTSECPCGWSQDALSLEEGVNNACTHYDACSKMEGMKT